MGKKTAGKAKAVRKALAVRRAKAVKTTGAGLAPIDAERLLNLLAQMRQLVLEQYRDLPRRQEAAPPPQEPADIRLSFLPANEETIRLFEWTVVADALQSLTNEVIEIDQNLMAEAVYGYYWAEERIMDPDETLSDEELANLVSFMEEVRAAWLGRYGTEIPPRK
jgi:hypothetical protein